MFNTFQSINREITKDQIVQQALAELNMASKVKYKLGPSAAAVAAVKKLEHEEGVYQQFGKGK